ncbi:hypothetical protein ILUMI_21009 [Ignelater luminosus]|uniref:Uncharacterized protein n=1 Tax=Ignelater luminosus TaxID=2038154 RepID=A0A8K0G428_IGNLU|nr:hypothetical protein ILUMI_21009 [Ignelater luminosus]
MKAQIHLAAEEATRRGENRTNYKNKKPYCWAVKTEAQIKEEEKTYQKWLTTGDQEDRRECRRQTYETKKKQARDAWKTFKNLRQNTHEQVKIEPIKKDKWVKVYSELLQEKRRLYIPPSYERKERQTHVEETTENGIRDAEELAKTDKLDVLGREGSEGPQHNIDNIKKQQH